MTNVSAVRHRPAQAKNCISHPLTLAAPPTAKRLPSPARSFSHRVATSSLRAAVLWTASALLSGAGSAAVILAVIVERPSATEALQAQSRDMAALVWRSATDLDRRAAR